MTTYLAAYQGGDKDASWDGSVLRGIGIATTTDFVTFTKRGQILAATNSYQANWESQQLFDPCLVDPGLGTLYCYYVGWDATQGVLPPGTLGNRSDEEALSGSVFRIGVATSTDGGATWTRSGSNPILSPGAGGAWDSYDVRHPYVVYDAGEANAAKRWKMWYLGQSGATDYGIGYAYSADGISWTKFGRVLAAASNGYAGLAVAYSAGTWNIFYGVQILTDPLHTDIYRVTCTSPEGTYTTHGSIITVPASYPQTNVDVTDTMLAGDTHMLVTSSASFTVGEQIYITHQNNQTVDRQVLATITAIPSSARIDFTPPVSQDFVTANGQGTNIVKLFIGAVQPRSVRQVGSDWVLFGTATGDWYGQADTFDPYIVKAPYGRAVAFKSASLASGWTIDYSRGPLLPLGADTSVWTRGSEAWDTDEADSLSVPLTGGVTTAFDPSFYHQPFTDIQHVTANKSKVVVISDVYDTATSVHTSFGVAVFDLTGTLLHDWTILTPDNGFGGSDTLSQRSGSCLDGTRVYFGVNDGNADEDVVSVELATGIMTKLFTIDAVDAAIHDPTFFGLGATAGIVEKEGDLIIAGSNGLARVRQDGTPVWWGSITDPMQSYRGLAHSGHGSVWVSQETNTADEWRYDGTYLRSVDIPEGANQAWLVGGLGWYVGAMVF